MTESDGGADVRPSGSTAGALASGSTVRPRGVSVGMNSFSAAPRAFARYRTSGDSMVPRTGRQSIAHTVHAAAT
jgi:hypothetical protein